jgi:hypothetical protein
MAGGKHAGENKQAADQVAGWSTEQPRQAEFHAVGEERTFGPRFENVVMLPKGERATHAAVDE